MYEITLATKITIARIVLIVPTMIFYVLGIYLPEFSLPMYIVSCLMFLLLCSSDFIDGSIARKTNTVSDLGKFLDPLADKVIIVVMMFLICFNSASLDAIFLYNGIIITMLSGLILSRELSIGVFRSIAAKNGTVLAADIYGKVKTVLLDIAVAFLILAPVHEIIAWIGTIIFYLGAIMTIISGVNYILKNKSVFEKPEKNETDVE